MMIPAALRPSPDAGLPVRPRRSPEGRFREERGKAAFFLWGSNRPSGHHTATFDICEPDIVKALEVWTHVIPKIMK